MFICCHKRRTNIEHEPFPRIDILARISCEMRKLCSLCRATTNQWQVVGSSRPAGHLKLFYEARLDDALPFKRTWDLIQTPGRPHRQTMANSFTPLWLLLIRWHQSLSFTFRLRACQIEFMTPSQDILIRLLKWLLVKSNTWYKYPSKVVHFWYHLAQVL